MKKIFLLLSIIITSSFVNINLAQKVFEGTIIYSIDYEDLPEEMEAMKAMLPSETVIKIKGSVTKTEQSMGMGRSISIFDASNNTAITLIDMMGRKMAMEIETKNDNEENDLNIKYIDETKEIAGYNCKKAEIKPQGEDEAVVVFYTEEINTKRTKSHYKGLKGFPMQYEINAQGLSITMKVKEVIEESVSDAEFTIPKGYDIVTPEEFQQQMTGGMAD